MLHFCPVGRIWRNNHSLKEGKRAALKSHDSVIDCWIAGLSVQMQVGNPSRGLRQCAPDWEPAAGVPHQFRLKAQDPVWQGGQWQVLDDA